MRVSRKALIAGEVTAFSFERYESPSVLIKNETDGEILFCDIAFDEDASLHIPAHSWQVINIAMLYDRTPTMFVRADVDGAVEIDFGSPFMGSLDAVRLFTIAGMMPVLALTEGENTTLTAEITRKYGSAEDLATAIPISSGSPLFVGDTLTLTVVATGEGNTAALTVNDSAVVLGESGAYSTIVTGNVTAVSAAVGS